MLVACGAAAGEPLLKPLADIPLPGATTRWDYESFDPANHRLYLAHLGDSSVVVIDTGAAKVVGEIRDVSHVHGVLVVPELHRVFASATGAHEVVAIDPATLAVTARVRAGAYPDGMAYAPAAGKLYVSDESGGQEIVIDARGMKQLAAIPLEGEAGNTAYDAGSGHIFVNVQTRGDLVEIDPSTDAIVARHPLPGAKGNHGLLIEPRARLAFIACEQNDRLLVFDLSRAAVTAGFDVGHEPDVLAFDAGRGWLYVAAEDGPLSVFELKDRALRPLGAVNAGAGAHVVGVDPETHRVYVPLKSVGGRPVLRVLQP